MPYSITTRDGITINNIPDSVDSNSNELKKRVSDIRSNRDKYESQPSPSEQPNQPEQSTNKPNNETTLKGLVGGAVRGAGPVVAGAALGAAVGAPAMGIGAIPGALAGASAAGLVQAVGDPIVGLVNGFLGTKYTKPTDALNDLFTKLGVPEPSTEAERITQAVVGGAAGGGAGAALGKVVTGVAKTGSTMANVGKAMSAAPAAQVVSGAGAGAAAQSVAEMGATPEEQLVAGVLGGLAAGALTPGTTGAASKKLVTTKQRIEQAGGDIAAAEQNRIPVMTSDVIPAETSVGKRIQQVGEMAPFTGTVEPKIKQQQSRIDAVKDTLRDFGAVDLADSNNRVTNNLLKQRSSDISKYTDMKQKVLMNVDSATNTITPQGVAESHRIVPVDNTYQSIKSGINTLRELRMPELNPVINKLAEWEYSTQNQNLQNLELIRKQIGETFKDPSLASVRSTADKITTNIYSSLRDDMGNFIKERDPKQYRMWTVANKRLSNMIGELDNSNLSSVLKSGNATPEVINKFLFSSKPSDVALLKRNLPQDGITAAKQSILSHAYERAGGSDNLNPTKFVNELDKIPAYKTFFTGSDFDRINGLSRALKLTKQAGEVTNRSASSPFSRFGLGSGTSLVTYFTLGSPGTAASLVTGGLARFYESPTFRNLIVKLGKTQENSQAERKLLNQLSSSLIGSTSSRTPKQYVNKSTE